VNKFTESEIEDFVSVIREHGFTKSDFDLKNEDDPLTPGFIQPLRGTITVTRKSNGKNRQYRTGHGSSWHIELERDLAAGEFR
jgi:hypothetical protein